MMEVDKERTDHDEYRTIRSWKWAQEQAWSHLLEHLSRIEERLERKTDGALHNYYPYRRPS